MARVMVSIPPSSGLVRQSPLEAGYFVRPERSEFGMRFQQVVLQSEVGRNLRSNALPPAPNSFRSLSAVRCFAHTTSKPSVFLLVSVDGRGRPVCFGSAVASSPGDRERCSTRVAPPSKARSPADSRRAGKSRPEDRESRQTWPAPPAPTGKAIPPRAIHGRRKSATETAQGRWPARPMFARQASPTDRRKLSSASTRPNCPPARGDRQ
jgi:hypothetical protein